ncbi:MAG TPA: hypothetical protein VFC84_19095 [Desulfosporosinus sp.]|nr:hypothetical protein [Desulfosporosinus sp.]
MSRNLTSGTRKRIVWVSLIMLLLFASLITLQWWVMALGVLTITIIILFKELGNPKQEKWVPSTGRSSDKVSYKSGGKSPINVSGTSIVAVTYKDERGVGMS